MVLLDFILLAPLVFGLIRGLFNGLVKELVSIAAIVLGIFLAYHYSEPVETYLSKHIEDSIIGLRALSYLLIFGTVLIASFALSFLLTKILQMLALGLLNRVLGGVFGLLKSLLIVLVILHLIQPYINVSFKESTNDSMVYAFLNTWSSTAGEWLTNIPLEDNGSLIQ